jgi:hypothetical protein
MADAPSRGGFPISAAILFGLGLGGFLDGIVLHQVLQRHHSRSRGAWVTRGTQEMAPSSAMVAPRSFASPEQPGSAWHPGP